MTWIALWAALAIPPAMAEEIAPDPAVYTCRVYVTGSDTRNRPAALEQCVRDVLVKLSGNPALLDDPHAALGTRAAGLVEDFVYLDLMSDIATHDEQGTRDRPFDLVGHVDPVGAAAELRALGRPAWTRPRPRIDVRVAIDRGGQSYALTADDERGERMRQALLAAADQFGVRVALPAEGVGMPPRDGAATQPTSSHLMGRFAWSDTEFGWIADWSLLDGPVPDAWQVRGVSFDAAFRSGIGGAASRLAGR